MSKQQHAEMLRGERLRCINTPRAFLVLCPRELKKPCSSSASIFPSLFEARGDHASEEHRPITVNLARRGRRCSPFGVERAKGTLEIRHLILSSETHLASGRRSQARACINIILSRLLPGLMRVPVLRLSHIHANIRGMHTARTRASVASEFMLVPEALEHRRLKMCNTTMSSTWVTCSVRLGRFRALFSCRQVTSMRTRTFLTPEMVQLNK